MQSKLEFDPRKMMELAIDVMSQPCPSIARMAPLALVLGP